MKSPSPPSLSLSFRLLQLVLTGWVNEVAKPSLSPASPISDYWLGKSFLLSPLSPQVCELDIIFNFEKAYFMLDELLLGGEVQETSKKNVLKAIAAQDLLQEVGGGGAGRRGGGRGRIPPDGTFFAFEKDYKL